jgi:hypothetical protein
MKKHFLLLLMLLIGFTFIHAQKSCPPGQIVVGVVYQIETLNFHKPRTDCKSGFGFCLRGDAHVHCTSINFPHQTSLRDGKATIWYQIKDNQFELHLPIALKDEEDFINEDLNSFTIDSNSISIVADDGESMMLRAGDYKVERTETDFIILIDFE